MRTLATVFHNSICNKRAVSVVVLCKRKLRGCKEGKYGIWWRSSIWMRGPSSTWKEERNSTSVYRYKVGYEEKILADNFWSCLSDYIYSWNRLWITTCDWCLRQMEQSSCWNFYRFPCGCRWSNQSRWRAREWGSSMISCWFEVIFTFLLNCTGRTVQNKFDVLPLNFLVLCVAFKTKISCKDRIFYGFQYF